MLTSREASWAETDFALLVQETLSQKSRKNQVILGYKEANMVRRDNRINVADNTILLALRLCWGGGMHSLWWRSPAGPHCCCVCSPSLALTPCLPKVLVPLCQEALGLATWINFQMQTMAGSAKSWPDAAQDVPPCSIFPMPLSFSSAVTPKGMGSSAEGALGVDSPCCTDLVRLLYPNHIIATFSSPKKTVRKVFGDFFFLNKSSKWIKKKVSARHPEWCYFTKTT